MPIERNVACTEKLPKLPLQSTLNFQKAAWGHSDRPRPSWMPYKHLCPGDIWREGVGRDMQGGGAGDLSTFVAAQKASRFLPHPHPQAEDNKVALKSRLFPLPHQSTPRDPAATPLGGGTAPSLQQGSSGACWKWRVAPHPKDPRWNLPVRWHAQNSGLS